MTRFNRGLCVNGDGRAIQAPSRFLCAPCLASLNTKIEPLARAVKQQPKKQLAATPASREAWDRRIFSSASEPVWSAERTRNLMPTGLSPAELAPLDPEVASRYTPPELPSLDGISSLELDLETNGLRWWGGARPIGIAVGLPDRFIYLPFGHCGGNLDESHVKEWAQRELRGKHLVGHNVKFDFHMMRAWGVDLEAQGCTLGDTMLDAALLDDQRRSGFGLDALSVENGVGQKVNGLDVSRLREYHAAYVAPYAEQDVALVRKLKQVFEPRLESEGLKRVQVLEERTLFATCEMEKNGAKIDVEKLVRWVKRSENVALGMSVQLREAAGFEVSSDSPKDLTRLFENLGLRVTRLTEQGGPSFTDEVLALYDHPIVTLVRQLRRLESLRSKYLLKYTVAVGTGDTLRFSLNQLRADKGGTISGRFSSSAPDGANSGANIQQVAAVERQRAVWGFDEDDASHDDEIFVIRELFVPDSGLFYAADAEQIEYRLFAHYANSTKIIDAYKKDPRTNFHKFVAAMVEPYRAGIPYKHVKNLNFAKVYGAGPRKIAAMLDLSLSETMSFVALYDQTFPEAGRLLAEASNAALRRGYVRTLLGRRTRFPNAERLHKALNGVIQGSAADVMKLKLCELHEARRQTGFTMRMTVHDEVCGDVPDAESARKVSEILDQQSITLRVPILWSSATGPCWSACA